MLRRLTIIPLQNANNVGFTGYEAASPNLTKLTTSNAITALGPSRSSTHAFLSSRFFALLIFVSLSLSLFLSTRSSLSYPLLFFCLFFHQIPESIISAGLPCSHRPCWFVHLALGNDASGPLNLGRCSPTFLSSLPSIIDRYCINWTFVLLFLVD